MVPEVQVAEVVFDRVGNRLGEILFRLGEPVRLGMTGAEVGESPHLQPVVAELPGEVQALLELGAPSLNIPRMMV
jgi:hypothetical protein